MLHEDNGMVIIPEMGQQNSRLCSSFYCSFERLSAAREIVPLDIDEQERSFH